MQQETVRDYINFNSKNYPDINFVTCPHTETKISNKNLKINLDKLNYYLTVQKEQKIGSLICTLTENSLSGIQLMLGIMYSGMIQVPLNLVAGEDQLAYIIEHSGSKILFSTKSNVELAKKIIKKTKCEIDLIEIDKDNFVNKLDNQKKDLIGINKSSNCLLMYTSGTTGKPKGVMLTHDNVLSGGKNVVDSHQLTSSDIAMCVLPLYHINGLIVTVMGPLVSQSSLVLSEKLYVV